MGPNDRPAKVYPLDICEFSRTEGDNGRVPVKPSAEDEKRALEWLENAECVCYPDEDDLKHRATLKAMLAEPRMPHPDSLTPKQLNAMGRAATLRTSVDGMRAAYRLLYDEVIAPPAPKTREVDVWHVEAFRHQDDMPTISLHTSQSGADATAFNLRDQPKPRHFSCVRVTGPHKQTVPAD